MHVAVQMLRRNARLMPHCLDVMLQLALLESAHAGNHTEALALVQHAMTLAPSSLTALTTLATVVAQAGNTDLALLALAASCNAARWMDRPAVHCLWPLGLPPYISVTEPQVAFWDPDVALCQALVADERKRSMQGSGTFLCL